RGTRRTAGVERRIPAVAHVHQAGAGGIVGRRNDRLAAGEPLVGGVAGADGRRVAVHAHVARRVPAAQGSGRILGLEPVGASEAVARQVGARDRDGRSAGEGEVHVAAGEAGAGVVAAADVVDEVVQ